MVHGDDFTFMGPKEEFKKVRAVMESWYDIKMRAILGEDEEDDKEVTFFGRLVKWEKRGGRTRPTRNTRK